jgi:hypothetical protein
MDEQEIDFEIKRLQELKDKARAKTADGVKIEVGQTLYEITEEGIKAITITNDLDVDGSMVFDPVAFRVMCRFEDLYFDAEKGKKAILDKVKEKLAWHEERVRVLEGRIEVLNHKFYEK